MTSKKRTNNKTIKAKPAPQVSGGVSFSQAVSWVSLLGAAVQLYLSLKILVSDKEFATLALSFVFSLSSLFSISSFRARSFTVRKRSSSIYRFLPLQV
jgi:hypothetical protein